MRLIFAVMLVLAAIVSSLAAQEAVYIIRHGEKELSGTDPVLTPEGRQRAADWAEMLLHVGIDAVITSDALRTKETGGIIADALGLQANALPRGNTASLLDALEFDHEADTVLIVAHAETIPRILEGVGILEDISVGQSEFTNLFVVLLPMSDDPVYLHFLMP